jgi:hypothetical protein
VSLEEEYVKAVAFMERNAITWERVVLAVEAAGPRGTTNRQIAAGWFGSASEAKRHEAAQDIAALTRLIAKADIIDLALKDGIANVYVHRRYRANRS